MGIRVVLACVGWSTYLYVPQRWAEEFWARFYAWVTPNATYRYYPKSEFPHLVRVEFPDRPAYSPSHTHAPFAPECTYVHLAAACFPLLVPRLRRRRPLEWVKVLLRASGIAVGLALVLNGARLLIHSRLCFLEYPDWLYNPRFYYHDIPNYLFFLLGVAIAFALGVRWLRNDFGCDLETA